MEKTPPALIARGFAVAAMVSAACFCTAETRIYSHGLRGYWGASDAFVDSEAKETNFGRDFQLAVGPKRKLLIRFADLDLPVGAVVKSAKLVLEKDLGDKNELVRISRIAQPWIEGPGRRGSLAMLNLSRKDPGAELRGNTWEMSGLEKWLSAPPELGAIGTQDSQQDFSITGLESDLNGFLTGQYPSYGWELVFESTGAFLSSDSPIGHPRLEIEFESAPPQPADIVVSNIAISDSDVTLTLANQGKESYAGTSQINIFGTAIPIRASVGGPIGPGEEKSVQIPLGENKRDAREIQIGWITAAGEEKSNNLISARLEEQAALPTSLSPAERASILRWAQWVNLQVFPHSRFSFAPAGVDRALELAQVDLIGLKSKEELLQRVLRHLGIPERRGDTSDWLPGLSGWGDCRDESAAPGLLPLQYEPIPNLALEGVPMPATPLLNATEVRFLTRASIRQDEYFPNNLMVRLTDTAGRPIGKLDVVLKNGEGAELGKFASGADGYVNLNEVQKWAKPDIFERYFLQAQMGNLVATASFAGWQIVDSAARAQGPVGSFFAILRPEPSVDPKVISTGRSVSTVSSNPDADKLTDGDLQTAISVPKEVGSWIEIDLQRDRLISEVQLSGLSESFYLGFQIQTYGTGETAKQARPWMIFTDSTWLRQTQPGDTVKLTGIPTVARYIRLLPTLPAKAPVQLSEFRVIAAP